jgi:hypothetical protein
MKQEEKEIVIDGVVYIPKNSVTELHVSSEGLKCVMIRTYSAGVHYGYLKKRNSTLAGVEVELISSRRVWQWSGAATLSQLAMEGTSNPGGCKMPRAVNSIELIAIEIIPMTKKAVASLNSVTVWTK